MTQTPEHPVEAYLRQMAEITRLMHQRRLNGQNGSAQREPLMYASYYEALLAIGEAMTPAKRPKGIRKQRDKQCFRNATHTMIEYGYAYVEGYAMSEYGNIVEHAWNVEDGVVIDTTWRHPEKAFYFGAVIPKPIMGALVSHHGVYGIIHNDWLIGNPLLKEGLYIPSAGLPAQKRKGRARP